MSEFKGTPGPWKWFTSNSHMRLSSLATGRDGDVVHAYTSADGMPVVNVKWQDAELIAAAPELLDAIQALVSLYEHDEGCRELVEYKRAKQATSKALGGRDE